MYYDAAEVQKRGTPVERRRDEHPWVPVGQRLIAVLSNGVRQIAVDVTNQREFLSFYRSYMRGAWMTFDLRLLTHEELRECPDEDP